MQDRDQDSTQQDSSTTGDNTTSEETSDEIGGDRRLKAYRRSYVDEYGAVNVQNCAFFDDVFHSIELHSEIAMYMYNIEEENLCAGICERSEYFKFSNINNGAPLDSCKDHILNHLGENMDTIGNMLTALIMIISIV